MAITRLNESQSFSYDSNAATKLQTFTVPFSGLYKLECTGAANPFKVKGAYAVRYVQLNKNDVLYIAVGGGPGGVAYSATNESNSGVKTAHGGWNGGGTGYANQGSKDTYAAGGGGATHIATALYGDGQLKHYENYKNTVLIVAGGAGGGCSRGNDGGSGEPGQGYKSSGHKFGEGGSSYTGVQAGAGGGGGWYGGAAGEAYYGTYGRGGSSWIGVEANTSTFIYNGTTYENYITAGGSEKNSAAAILTSVYSDNGSYSINYELNGGACTSLVTDGFIPLETYALPEPKRRGFNFTGWHKKSDFSDDAISEITSNNTNTITLYASWVPANFEYEYTGTIESFIAPYSGIYKLEAYGAQGGAKSNGAKGGYSVGYVHLTVGTELFIGVGGKGSFSTAGGAKIEGGYNGGGTVTKGYSTNNGHTNGSGGGASHIATTNRGVLSKYADYKDEVLIVAGGGGGSGSAKGGAGGGLIGGNGGGDQNPGKGATQTAGGGGYYTGSFGKGANAQETYGVGAGGGGWYGGGGSGPYSAGGGGSGYIGGVPSFLNKKNIYAPDTVPNVREGDGHVTISPIFENDLFYLEEFSRIVSVTELVYDGVEITSLSYDGTLIYEYPETNQAKYLIPSAEFSNTSNWTHTGGDPMVVNADGSITLKSAAGDNNTTHNCLVDVDLTNYTTLIVNLAEKSTTDEIKFVMQKSSDSATTFEIACPTKAGVYTVDVTSYLGRWKFYCYTNNGQTYTISELCLGEPK